MTSNRPLGPVVIVTVGVMAASAVFWVGFMLAPAAVLLIGYLALSASDRAQRQRHPLAPASGKTIGEGRVRAANGFSSMTLAEESSGVTSRGESA